MMTLNGGLNIVQGAAWRGIVASCANTRWNKSFFQSRTNTCFFIKKKKRCAGSALLKSQVLNKNYQKQILHSFPWIVPVKKYCSSKRARVLVKLRIRRGSELQRIHCLGIFRFFCWEHLKGELTLSPSGLGRAPCNLCRQPWQTEKKGERNCPLLGVCSLSCFIMWSPRGYIVDLY